MKKGFTLVEMLIVVVVLVTLMGITFRLSSLGGASTARNKTVARIQRLENCLSGYYAAFGTYPAVPLHGSRNYKLKVSPYGIQNVDGEEEELRWDWKDNRNSEGESEDWSKVEAACKAQPVDCRFPFPSNGRYAEYVKAVSAELQTKAKDSGLRDEFKQALEQGFDDGVSSNLGRFNAYEDETEWRDLQLFKFGLMSFLLPRYLVMMNSDETLYENFSQWTGNNALPADPLSGQTFVSWRELRRRATSDQNSDIARVANIPSQAVCARWIPNLERICACNHAFKLFGVDIRDPDQQELSPNNVNIQLFTPGGYDQGSSSGNQYVLDAVTVKDGWGNEFYYYSPQPYQTYVLWSAGANEKTFPPWVPRDSLDSKANECVALWVEDDIINMSN
jgi:prepilin-type N-terminal cleavage/methylation domain-containing protein